MPTCLESFFSTVAVLFVDFNAYTMVNGSIVTYTSATIRKGNDSSSQYEVAHTDSLFTRLRGHSLTVSSINGNQSNTIVDVNVITIQADIAGKTAIPNARNELIARLRGQTIVLPDLFPIYVGYTVRSHTNISLLQDGLEDWLKTFIPTEKLRAKQRKTDAPFLSAHFWPRVPTDRLAVLNSFCLWAFIWDDEIDCGSLTYDDEGRVDAYCDNAIAYIRSVMQPDLNVTPPVHGIFHNSGCFSEIGAAMQTGQTLADRDRFIQSIVRFINTVRRSHDKQIAGDIDSVEAYMKRRVITSSIETFVHTLVWAYDLSMPAWIWEHEATKVILWETEAAIALYNDIASLKKELDGGEVDSIVPILVYNEDITAQEAVNKTVHMLASGFGEFRSAADRLRAAVSNDDIKVKSDVDTWIEGCVDLILGNMAWSLKTERYMAKAVVNLEGTGYTARMILYTEEEKGD
ncbi:isoprenoid synthase domain-containing protein [Paraphoma chrysanthemicola]|uniref:Terpene synthase n=1 Tax=Paraphoma chrysanthemicola TaxID=798071 RepID=A0A8K0VVA4_9PLEO|nr:isoprenoid synthase domain-containing protein [Paraphoma chrysanthemicola]